MDDEKRIPIRTLKLPAPMSAEELATLQKWGDLPEIVPLPDAAGLIAKICEQDKSAILKVLEGAIWKKEIRFWGLSNQGGWRESMLVTPPALPKDLKINKKKGKFSFTLPFGSSLLYEAIGINPRDTVDLLRKRGQKVPDALLDLYPTVSTNSGSAEISPSQAPAFVKKINGRKDPMTALISLAKSSAVDANDVSSVWASLVKIAEQTDRKAPLVGYVEGEGVKFDDNGKTKFFTRKNLKDRMNRSNAR